MGSELNIFKEQNLLNFDICVYVTCESVTTVKIVNISILLKRFFMRLVILLPLSSLLPNTAPTPRQPVIYFLSL